MAWEGNDIKVVDILNDQIIVTVAELTVKSECIKEIYLDIEGEEMVVWRNTASNNVKEIIFENLLSEKPEKSKNLLHFLMTNVIG